MAKNTKNPEKAAQEQPQEQSPTKEQELVSQLQRLQAEFDNYRKRVEAESQRAAEKGQEKLIKDVLAIVDSMELALKHNTEKENELTKGLELIYSQFLSALESWGVHRIQSEGPVDPRLHEVYITDTSDTVQPNHILETLQHGYTRSGVVLRTAKVKAARKA